MIFKPTQLGRTGLSEQELSEDKTKCKKYGPCGVGEKALYLNSFYIDRRYYVPFDAVTRVFKRVAMSKGGFNGKGMFASIPYLVVVYDDGREKQCNFKYEENVDRMLLYIGRMRPDIKLLSEAAEQRLLEKERQREKNRVLDLPKEAEKELEKLNEAYVYLKREPELSLALSETARRKRAFEKSSPTYKWVAAAIFALGFCSLLYGVYALYRHMEFAVYFTLFGMAAIFLFSGAGIFPTSRNNKRYIMNHAEMALDAVSDYIQRYEGSKFPLPAYYAHPIVLKRMMDAIQVGRAVNADEALQIVKSDLKALNSSVEVEQEEYDEVVAIKSLFLNVNYK